MSVVEPQTAFLDQPPEADEVGVPADISPVKAHPMASGSPFCCMHLAIHGHWSVFRIVFAMAEHLGCS